MLSKLLKYEFRATGRVFLPMYAILLVMSAVARFLYHSPTAESFGLLLLLRIVVTIVVIGLFTAVVVVTLILICRRFWQNLLGREGYLMNVLPVSKSAHVWSKLIVAAVWTILSSVLSVAAVFILVGGFAQFANLPEIWRSIWAEISRNDCTSQGVVLVTLVLVMVLVTVLSRVLQIYASMCIGQLANKHRIWASVGAYFGIGIVQSMIVSRFVLSRFSQDVLEQITGDNVSINVSLAADSAVPAVNTMREALVSINTELAWSLALTVLISAVLFFVTQWILKKHLNLQ